ncbi:hypothetical protein JCM16303_006573 [Sporobolomyces ruberrimus]
MNRVPPPVADTLSFTPERSLLQPKFESYKLALPTSSSPTQSYPLPTPFATRPLSDGARLSFAETQARARHNHLGHGERGELIWVERDGKVKAARLDRTTAVPSFFDVFQLPCPSSTAAPDLIPAYPVAIALTSSLWLVSDGIFTLFLLDIDPSTLQGHLTSTFIISSSSPFTSRPLHLHRADLSPTDPEEALVLLSVVQRNSKAVPSQDPHDSDQPKLGQATSRLQIPSSTSFEYFAVKIPLSPTGGATTELAPEWRMTGSDLPAFVDFDSRRERYCIASSSPLNSTKPVPSSSAVAREDGPFGAATDREEHLVPSTSTLVPKPPPFSWTQESASLTVAFPIPSTTPTSSIRITLSRLYLTLHIASPSAAASNSSPHFALPHVSHKRWWGEIDPHTSVWTFDREAEGRDSNFGILTLHLEKQHAGTKWSDVFATTARPEDGTQSKIQELEEEWDYEEVAETVDPSELAKISEDMEKWTRGIMEGGASNSNEGLGHGVPTSLMGDEMDVEIDADTGRSIVVSWIERDAERGEPKVVTPHPTLSYSLLSLPLPLACSSSATPATNPLSSSITIKHDVDGLAFQTPSANLVASSPYRWVHSSTFPALAFVLASKRDAKFVYHYLDQFALAFDVPPRITPSKATDEKRDGGGNCFAYFAPQKNETKGKQMVIRVGTATSGTLLGVVGVELEGGEVVVAALCERELVVMRLT